jgi:putative sterol carrier protein
MISTGARIKKDGELQKDGEPMSIQQILQDLIDRFNERIETDEKLQAELKGMDRSVQIELHDPDRTQYLHFFVRDMTASAIEEESLEDPDINIISSEDSIQKLINGELRPMKAWATGKLKIKAKNTEDVFRLRKLF